MKRALVYLVFAFASLAAKSQLPDSVQRKYDTASTFRVKRGILADYYYFSLKGTPSEHLKYLLAQLSYFTKKKDNTGIGYTYILFGGLFGDTGDLSVALKYGIDALKIFEEIKDTSGLLDAYQEIAASYVDSKNTEQAIKYWKKGLSISNINSFISADYLNGTADCFNKMKLPDSALHYAQEAVRIASEFKEDTISLSLYLGTMGEVYISLGENDIARSFIRQSLFFAKKAGTAFGLSYCMNDLSQSFFNTSQYDSSLAYARQGLLYDYPGYLLLAETSYELIYKTFDKENKIDSSNKYFRLAMQVKDSILSDEKSKSIQSQNFQEEIRQQQIETQKEELALQHKHNIENALIALGIICFTILFLLMSRRFIANANLIKFLGVLALLLVFEFINLLVHSYVEEATHHSQLLMLLILVGLAALLIPLHHKIEHWTIHKLVEKNKELRLAAAKRTIAKLVPQDETPNDEPKE